MAYRSAPSPTNSSPTRSSSPSYLRVPRKWAHKLATQSDPLAASGQFQTTSSAFAHARIGRQQSPVSRGSPCASDQKIKIKIKINRQHRSRVPTNHKPCPGAPFLEGSSLPACIFVGCFDMNAGPNPCQKLCSASTPFLLPPLHLLPPAVRFNSLNPMTENERGK